MGIKVDKISKDEVKLSQPAFTKKIIEQVNLKDQRQHLTPADQVLTRDSEGECDQTTQLFIKHF